MPKLSEILGKTLANSHPSSKIAQALKRAGVPDSPELRRILALPKRDFDPKAYADLSPLYAKRPCGAPKCSYCENGAPSLRPIQSAMLHEASSVNGGFFNVGIGQGKTLAGFLLHDVLRARRTVLLVPPNLKAKTLQVDLPELGKHFVLPTIHTRVPANLPDGLYVIAYSELSNKKSTGLLDKIKPDLIIADEAHSLCNPGAARTRRFLRFMRANQCRFVCMSGTLMKRSIRDSAHLAELALGKNSPYPKDFPTLITWAEALDTEGEDFRSIEPGFLKLFCNPNEPAQEGFSRRLLSSPGVISTTETACSKALEINLIHVTPPKEVTDALKELETSWAWDGEEFDSVLEISRLQRCITQGFFYRLVWPNGLRDNEWMDARNAWNRAVRHRLSATNRVGADSPSLLQDLAESGEWDCPEWCAWKDIRGRSNPGRETEEVSRWLVQRCLQWVGKEPILEQSDADRRPLPGIIWVSSPVVGTWLREAGITYFGEGDDQALLSYISDCEKGKRNAETIACSIKAHGTGKNLQKVYSRNLVIYCPSSGQIWEQMIGRTWRPGQKADVVTFDVFLTDTKAWEQAKSDAHFAKTIGKQPQALNMATLTITYDHS